MSKNAGTGVLYGVENEAKCIERPWSARGQRLPPSLYGPAEGVGETAERYLVTAGHPGWALRAFKRVPEPVEG